MSFPGDGQCGNLFSSSRYWEVRALRYGSNSRCMQLLPGPFYLHSLGFGNLIDS